MTFPKQIRALHQIEITTLCSMKCVYCPSPDIVKGKYPERKAGHMTRMDFVRALEWVSYFVKQGTQTELNMAGIGESFLHPEFVDFMKLAREAIGPKVKLVLATNGTHVTEENAAALAPLKPEIWVSLHKLEVGAKADEILRRHGIAGQVSADGALNANDWAGQVKVPWKKNYKFPCQFMNEGKAVVLSDGRISRCCLDATGEGVIGHVAQPIGSIKTDPWKLCVGCYQTIEDPDHPGQILDVKKFLTKQSHQAMPSA